MNQEPLRSAALIPILLLAWATGATSQGSPPTYERPDDPTAFPVVIDFDTTRHHVFFYGHEIIPPLILTFDGERLIANGFGPHERYVDTAKVERLARERRGDIPFVRKLVAHGYTYRAAVATYDSLWSAQLDEARRIQRELRDQGRTDATSQAVAVLDTNLFDLRDTVLIGPPRTRFTLKGYQVYDQLEITGEGRGGNEGPYPTKLESALSQARTLGRLLSRSMGYSILFTGNMQFLRGWPDKERMLEFLSQVYDARDRAAARELKPDEGKISKCPDWAIREVLEVAYDQ